MEAPEPGKQDLIEIFHSIFSLQNLSSESCITRLVEPNGVRLCLQRALEAFTIILAGTQLLCVGSLHAGANAAIVETPMGMGRPRV